MDISVHQRIVINLRPEGITDDYYTIQAWDAQESDDPRYLIRDIEVIAGRVWITGRRIKKDGKPSEVNSNILVDVQQLPDRILRELGVMYVWQTTID